MQNDTKVSKRTLKNSNTYRISVGVFFILLFLISTGSAMSFSGYPVFPPEIPIIKSGHVDIEPRLIGGTNAIDESILNLALYPEEAREKGIQGSAAVQFIVDEKGRTGHCVILEGNPEGYGFGEAAREAVLNARYKPGVHCNRPVRVLMKITIQFGT